MRQIVTNVYTFDELDDAAKERARVWYRANITGDDVEFYTERSIDEFVTLACALGFTTDAKSVRWDTNPIGASFDGSWCASRLNRKMNLDACMDILKDRPLDVDTQKVINGFLSFAALYPDSAGQALHVRRGVGLLTEFDIGGDDNGEHPDAKAVANRFEELTGDLAHILAIAVDAELTYASSDEVIDENIRCNEYEFDETGVRA